MATHERCPCFRPRAWEEIGQCFCESCMAKITVTCVVIRHSTKNNNAATIQVLRVTCFIHAILTSDMCDDSDIFISLILRVLMYISLILRAITAQRYVRIIHHTYHKNHPQHAPSRQPQLSCPTIAMAHHYCLNYHCFHPANTLIDHWKSTEVHKPCCTSRNHEQRDTNRQGGRSKIACYCVFSYIQVDSPYGHTTPRCRHVKRRGSSQPSCSQKEHNTTPTPTSLDTPHCLQS